MKRAISVIMTENELMVMRHITKQYNLEDSAVMLSALRLLGHVIATKRIEEGIPVEVACARAIDRTSDFTGRINEVMDSLDSLDLEVRALIRNPRLHLG